MGFIFFTNRRLSMYIKRDPFLGLGFAVFVLLTRLRFKQDFSIYLGTKIV